MEISKYPGSIFDCTVVADNNTSVRAVLEIGKKVKASELESVSIVGTFDLEENQKSITLRFYFHSSDKTIESKRIKELEILVVQNLEKNNFFLKN